MGAGAEGVRRRRLQGRHPEAQSKRRSGKGAPQQYLPFLSAFFCVSDSKKSICFDLDLLDVIFAIEALHAFSPQATLRLISSLNHFYIISSLYTSTT